MVFASLRQETPVLIEWPNLWPSEQFRQLVLVEQGMRTARPAPAVLFLSCEQMAVDPHLA
jgi:hypothetical protein